MVSVVLPVKDGAETLETALESIARQTLDEWECLVVDDGSSDSSREIAENWQKRDERFHSLECETEGIASALNTGIAAAQGKWIARMDADDESAPERLETQLEFARRNRDVEVIASRVEYGGNRDEREGFAVYVDWMNELLTHDEISLNRFVESPVAHPSVMFLRNLLQRHGGYREGGFPEDYELWLRWLDVGVRFGKTPEALLTWNDRDDRLTRTDERYSNESFYRLKGHFLGRWIRREVDGDRPIWIWGAGRTARRRAEFLSAEAVGWQAWVDIDKAKIGQVLDERPVFPPDALRGNHIPFVISYVASRGARDEIRKKLRGYGRVEGRDFICAA